MQLIGNGIATDVEEEQWIDVGISPNPATSYIEVSLDGVMLSETKEPVVKIYDGWGMWCLHWEIPAFAGMT